MSDVPLYLLWSMGHRQWWRPNRLTYTTDIEQAGRFGPATAARYALQAALNGSAAQGEVIVVAPRPWTPTQTAHASTFEAEEYTLLKIEVEQWWEEW